MRSFRPEERSSPSSNHVLPPSEEHAMPAALPHTREESTPSDGSNASHVLVRPPSGCGSLSSPPYGDILPPREARTTPAALLPTRERAAAHTWKQRCPRPKQRFTRPRARSFRPEQRSPQPRPTSQRERPHHPWPPPSSLSSRIIARSVFFASPRTIIAFDRKNSSFSTPLKPGFMLRLRTITLRECSTLKTGMP